MLTVYFPGATSKCQAYLGHNATKDASLSNVTSVRLGPITCSTVSPRLDFCCYNTVDCFRCSWSYWKDRDQLNTGLLPLVVSRKWLCRSRSSLSQDDEYRSSRNIAISLLRRYRNVIDRGGGDTLNDFISAGVNAYALGCSNEGLRKELIAIKESGLEVGGIESYSRTTIKSKIVSNEVDECILWVSIIFITILCTPQPTVVRWSSTPPVSDEILLQWKGFCALIANAYYIRGMAWLPVKTLQLEQTAVMGHAEEPSVVSSRMRLVFSTLEVVSPQWPKV